MRLASFNIKNGLSDDGSCDPDALVAACRGLRADVLALQEVDRGVPRSNEADQTSIVANGCGLTGIYAPARRLDGGEYGNALLARGSFVDVEHVRLPVMPGNEARAVVLARVQVDDTDLSVAATHLQNRHGGPPPTSADAAEQLEQLEVVLAALARRPRPRALLGDLNMPPEVTLPVLQAAGYEVADSEPTVVVGAPKFRIDYVAVDGGAVGQSEVLDTDVSDHRALVVEVDPVER
ncbi:MAG: endonuclease/exonuclease/phosphatase family protein [Acidimicrobiia bacterium]